jgi:hypothetical protein
MLRLSEYTIFMFFGAAEYENVIKINWLALFLEIKHHHSYIYNKYE